MTEQRRLSLHENMLHTIIAAQAGTLDKAILELVMNSVDAGATRVDIRLEENTACVVDDGRGFQSRKEIEDWFETFGTPHQEGDAVYGRFRMGRGQIMAFAATQWQTRRFRMDVDIKKHGFDYTLNEVKKDMPGCHIDARLYDPLLPSEVETVSRELREMCRYVAIPVHLNGQCISQDPAQAKWSIETDDAWIQLKGTNSLKVYNLGVFVREYPAYHHGTGGIIVSKRQLEVNSARNDVLASKCPVWKRIREHLREKNTEQKSKRKTLTDDDRQFLINRFRFGEVSAREIFHTRLFCDAQGRYHHLCKLLYQVDIPITVAPEQGSRLAEKIHMDGRAFVLAPKTLEQFGCDSIHALGNLLRELMTPTGYRYPMFQTVDFGSIAKEFQQGYFIVPEKKLSPNDLAALQALGRTQRDFAWMLGRALGHDVAERKIFAGASDDCQAWTDGKNFVAIEQRLLKKAQEGHSGFTYLAGLLLHEYLHADKDTDAHDHSFEFYENFERVTNHPQVNLIGNYARVAYLRYTATLKNEGRRLSRKLLKEADAEAAVLPLQEALKMAARKAA